MKHLKGERKVPRDITLSFWLLKLLTTALGEAFSDYLISHYNPYVAVIVSFIVFAVVLVMQVRAKRFHLWLYWLAVLMVAVFGTMAADVTHVALGVPYILSAVVFSGLLITCFLYWKWRFHTLSIHSVRFGAPEVVYWLTIFCSFALGTALGDMTAYALGLGFLTSLIVFSILFLIPTAGWGWLRWNAIFCFWACYVLTRPIGASFADLMAKSRQVGGLGVGDGIVVAVLLGLLILTLIVVTIQSRRIGAASSESHSVY